MKATLTRAHQAVIGAPEPDALRLAYADACDAAGEPERAAFVRLQLDQTMRMREGSDTWWDPGSRALELLRKNDHQSLWAGLIADRVPWHEFHRGFVEKIKLDASSLLNQANELYSLAPIRRLLLTGISPVAERLFTSPLLDRIVSLSIERDEIGDREVELLAASPHVKRLAWLDLGGNAITTRGLRAMAQSANFPALKYVDFRENPVSTEATEHVGEENFRIVYIEHGLAPIEQIFGRKTWLHPVADHGSRFVHEAEF